ncbi:tyrosine-type recombinase/integrase [Flavobacterium sp. LB1P62]|uniref:tyrosine-type recombinase/integrase n=1 Tax=Flavobacterium sp. LB1P62 TaxID=3401715 RepID=UPI003AAB6506
MKKLKLPKNPYLGMKIFCHKCKRDNPSCDHYDIHKYKVKIHIPGGDNKKKTKVLDSKDYAQAVKEAIKFKEQLEANNFNKPIIVVEENNFTMLGALIEYRRYLSGEHRYTHMVKNISKGYQDECMRYCKYFLDTFKGVKNVSETSIRDVSQDDVARFYSWTEKHYKEKTFNKCLSEIKSFFKFIIEVEKIEMKNPFEVYVSKKVTKSNIYTLDRSEFEDILKAVHSANPIVTLGGRGEKKNMYRNYLIDGFKLSLLTGGRREEVVDLKWSDIFTTVKDVKFFKIKNIKVELLTDEDHWKYIPINTDLMNLLLEFGYNDKKQTNDFILFPERQVLTKTIMNDLSKGFTHYKKMANIDKKVSFKNLRKTYLSWVNAVMNKDTGILSSHSTYEILERYYIDPAILTVIEEGALKISVFGT